MSIGKVNTYIYSVILLILLYKLEIEYVVPKPKDSVSHFVTSSISPLLKQVSSWDPRRIDYL